MTYLSDLLHRLRASLSWVAAQFWAIALIALAGIGFTRLPDKYAWQVLLSLFVPLLIVVATLLLQAKTMRSLLPHEPQRNPLWQGALMLLAWAIVVWAAWAILDWCGDQIPLWAGYLNSRASAHSRARVFTYAHLMHWLTLAEWVFRWIVTPGKVIPWAIASVVSGWRLPFGRVLRLLWNWRWWPSVIAAALVGVALPVHFFAGLPHGTVRQQTWAVIFKLSGSYLLIIASWVLLLAWAAVLLARQAQPSEDALDQQVLQRLYKSRLWLAALAGWVLLTALIRLVSAHWPGSLGSRDAFATTIAIVMLGLLVIAQAGILRSMVSVEEKRVRFIWGLLSTLVWTFLGVILAFLIEVPDIPLLLRIACLLLAPGVFIPIGALSSQRGFRLPWRRVPRVLSNWKWWVGVLVAVVVGFALPALLQPDPSHATYSSQGIPVLRHFVAELLALTSWILLMGWAGVLMDSNEPSANSPGDDEMHVVPIGYSPVNNGSAASPLPESGDGGGRNG